jgi:uncharacterized membrane protein
MFFSAAFKAKARDALRQHWQTALLIALIVNLPSLLVQGIAAFTNNDPLTRVQDLMIRAYSSQTAMNTLQDSILKLFSETGILVMTGLSVLVWLITPALSMGMNHWMLDRIRGQEEPVSTVFSRLRILPKSIGLRLFLVWKIFLWTLPGLAVSLLSLIPALNARGKTGAELASAAAWSMNLMYFGMTVMLILGIMGYLYYAQADFILADEPEERVLACARRSREMMKGRRMVLMTLLLSFVLLFLLISFASAAFGGMAGTVIALMLQMLGTLFLSVYMLAT